MSFVPDVASVSGLSIRVPLMFVLLVFKAPFLTVFQFEDIKGVIIIRISKKNRQHNGQKKKYKRTNNDLQNMLISFVVKFRS